MNETRFLKIIVAALLALNIGTLGFLWMDHRKGGPHPPPPGSEGPRGGNAGQYLRRALHLSDAQESAYRDMREHHHAAVEGLRDHMREQKQRLYGLMQDADTISAGSNAAVLIDSLAAGQRQVELITYNHFRELRALCTPSQQKDFDEAIGEALERMR